MKFKPWMGYTLGAVAVIVILVLLTKNNKLAATAKIAADKANSADSKIKQDENSATPPSGAMTYA